MARKTNTKKADQAFALISRKKLLGLYADLLQCRMIEARLGARRMAGRAAPAVAVAGALGTADEVIASLRDPLPSFVKARKRGEVLAALGNKGSERSPSPAALVNSALAAARRHQSGERQSVVAVFATEAWTKSAAWDAALQAAAAERLPILFVAPGAAAAPMGKRGFPVIPVDREDVVALYRVAFESLAHARRGNGATLIECRAWEFAVGNEPADAIAKMERYLTHAGIPWKRTRARVTASFQAQLNAVKSSK